MTREEFIESCEGLDNGQSFTIPTSTGRVIVTRLDRGWDGPLHAAYISSGPYGGFSVTGPGASGLNENEWADPSALALAVQHRGVRFDI